MSVSRVKKKKTKMRNFTKSYSKNERGEYTYDDIFLATTEGGCNINNNHLLLLKLLLLPRVLGVYESVFVFLRGTVPGVIFFHASHLYSAEALSMVSERPQGVAHSFS